MSKEVNNPKIEMINEVIFLTKVSEELWSYHPDNPNQIDVEKQYHIIQGKITKLQDEISKLDK
jgi:hypothetical protein